MLLGVVASFSDDKDNTKSKARVLAWQHTLLRDEEKEKKKKEYDPESDPSIAFLSLARAFLRSKNDDDESSGVSYLKDSKTSLSKCLQAMQRCDPSEEFRPMEEEIHRERRKRKRH